MHIVAERGEANRPVNGVFPWWFHPFDGAPGQNASARLSGEDCAGQAKILGRLGCYNVRRLK
jgi:hypothetical protein